MTAIERYQALVQFVLKVNPALDTGDVLAFANEAEVLTRRKRGSETRPAKKAVRAAGKSEAA